MIRTDGRLSFALPAMLMALLFVTAFVNEASAKERAVSAVELAVKNKFDAAFDAARRSGDTAAIKTVEWFYLRRNPRDAGYDRLMRFVRANPNWPQVSKIEAAAEAQLLLNATPVDVIATHFPYRTPVSTRGWLARARYALAKGDKKTAKARLMKAWLDPVLDKEGEAYAARAFKSLLTKRDHAARMQRLILAQKTTSAVRVAKRISNAHVHAAKVARNLIKVKKGSLTAYGKLSKSFRKSIAMRYAVARYYRKKNKRTKALSMLLALPKDTSRHLDHEQWWVEKRLIARYLLGAKYRKHWPNAYRLTSSHGFTTSGKQHSEGEFLSGWIALRKLNQAPIALGHFQKMAKRAENRTQSSRAYYWMARTYLELGNAAAADRAFRKSAASPTLFYGQLSREALGLGRKPIPVRSAAITPAARKAARNNELVRSFRLLVKAKADRFWHSWLWPMAGEFKTTSELSAVAEIVKKEAGLTASVRFAKRAGSRGVDIDDWGYPVGALPKWSKIGKPVETALVYGLSRQESEFHAQAKSHAGARGLMQIMPSTGRLIARQYKLRYSVKKLTADPKYNVTLGAAHLGDLIDNFNGSYVLTFIGYNAGPRRAFDWMKDNGDPRLKHVDVVDWIESIPFTETRKYVQKVMQNIHVYRSRLRVKRHYGMTADLKRGGKTRIQPTTGSGARALTCGGGAGSIDDLVQDC
ncbi:MAG: lytic transglycosylase domain-containing protein [Rhizobiales bacterium]|nr:lytic transglycosylase domain-containing protein [Hyphomicrobiales bacterium]